jgi:anti-sigma factor RsiW
MKCTTAKRLLQDHLDHALLPIDRAAVESHLHECDACRAEGFRLRLITRGLDRLPEPDVPQDFVARVMADLPEMLPAQHGTGHVLRWGLVAAAVLFTFLASLTLLVRESGPEVARQTLEPLGASLHLAGLLLAHAAGAAATLLDAASHAFALAGWPAKLLFVLAFVMAHAALLAALKRYQPLLRVAPRRVGRA